MATAQRIHVERRKRREAARLGRKHRHTLDDVSHYLHLGREQRVLKRWNNLQAASAARRAAKKAAGGGEITAAQRRIRQTLSGRQAAEDRWGEFQRQTEAACKLQARARWWLCRRRLRTESAAMLRLQSHVRGRMGRQRAAALRRERRERERRKKELVQDEVARRLIEIQEASMVAMQNLLDTAVSIKHQGPMAVLAASGEEVNTGTTVRSRVRQRGKRLRRPPPAKQVSFASSEAMAPAPAEIASAEDAAEVAVVDEPAAPNHLFAHFAEQMAEQILDEEPEPEPEPAPAPALEPEPEPEPSQESSEPSAASLFATELAGQFIAEAIDRQIGTVAAKEAARIETEHQRLQLSPAPVDRSLQLMIASAAAEHQHLMAETWNSAGRMDFICADDSSTDGVYSSGVDAQHQRPSRSGSDASDMSLTDSATDGSSDAASDVSLTDFGLSVHGSTSDVSLTDSGRSVHDDALYVNGEYQGEERSDAQAADQQAEAVDPEALEPEARSAIARFDRYDVDGDGLLDTAELRGMLLDLGFDTPDDKYLAELAWIFGGGHAVDAVHFPKLWAAVAGGSAAAMEAAAAATEAVAMATEGGGEDVAWNEDVAA